MVGLTRLPWDRSCHNFLSYLVLKFQELEFFLSMGFAKVRDYVHRGILRLLS